MANLLGAMIGAAIDRQDGDSGIKGMIMGTVAEGAVRMAGARRGHMGARLGGAIWVAQGLAGGDRGGPGGRGRAVAGGVAERRQLL